MSSTGHTPSTPTPSGNGGVKIPKFPWRWILILATTSITVPVAISIAKTMGTSEKNCLLLGIGMALAVPTAIFFATKKYSHHDSHGGHDAHGHGENFLEVYSKRITMVAIAIIVCIWTYSTIMRNFGPEADEIRNARRESEEQLRRIAKGLDGLFSQVTNRVTAPVVDLNKVPKTECPRKPEFFSKSIPLPTGVNFGWQTIGSTGTLMVWDGQGKIWECKPGEKHDFPATELAFVSVSGQPIEVEVVYQHKPRRY